MRLKRWQGVVESKAANWITTMQSNKYGSRWGSRDAGALDKFGKPCIIAYTIFNTIVCVACCSCIWKDTLSATATVMLSIHLQISTHVVGTCIIPSPNLHISKQYVCHRLLWISANTWCWPRQHCICNFFSYKASSENRVHYLQHSRNNFSCGGQRRSPDDEDDALRS